MWLVPAIFAVLALFAAGCSRTVFPGDGRLVIVEIDPALDAVVLQLNGGGTTTVGACIRTGIRMWDAVGARFRTHDQLLPNELSEVNAAPRLFVYSDDDPKDLGKALDGSGGNVTDAQFSDFDQHIVVHLKAWPRVLDPYGLLWPANVIAHEVGHAMSLDHVSDPMAIMFPMRTRENERANLSDADLREHARVWP